MATSKVKVISGESWDAPKLQRLGKQMRGVPGLVGDRRYHIKVRWFQCFFFRQSRTYFQTVECTMRYNSQYILSKVFDRKCLPCMASMFVMPFRTSPPFPCLRAFPFVWSIFSTTGMWLISRLNSRSALSIIWPMLLPLTTLTAIHDSLNSYNA